MLTICRSIYNADGLRETELEPLLFLMKKQLNIRAKHGIDRLCNILQKKNVIFSKQNMNETIIFKTGKKKTCLLRSKDSVQLSYLFS